MNLDDFSEGSAVLSGAQRGFSPVIFHGTQNQKSNQKPRKSVSKEHACFSKQTIQKQIRREYVAALEEKLTRHPLTTFPHYKDHMTPELFFKVASILDPDMSVNDASGLPTPTGHNTTEENGESCREPSKKEQ
nr:protein FAM47E-like [Labrus bergylta]